MPEELRKPKIDVIPALVSYLIESAFINVSAPCANHRRTVWKIKLLVCSNLNLNGQVFDWGT